METACWQDSLLKSFTGDLQLFLLKHKLCWGEELWGKVLVNFEKARVVPSLCRQDLQKQIIKRYFRSI